ncbi:MAG TPA: GNAT family N-acetyltransferase [Albidovulum sp.]|uniref:GNAT family N-acetyltransferase n=1 Tax=Albidovulum sp. TaxID=1872424 RepID=UPI002C8A817E|nr:GNAT family N-acetyltransferase [Albidovulum sp.]
MVPVIETERLILRGFERADFPAYVALWQEPEVVRFIGGTPRSENESWGRFLGIVGHWTMEGFGQWAIARREDGVVIGQTGFFRAMRGIGEDFDAAPETGWVLSAPAHGRGLGGEAVAAAHRWFGAQPFGGVSHAMIEVGHEASFAVARRLGYQALRETEYSGDRVMLLRRDRPS